MDYEANLSTYETVSSLGQCFEGLALVTLAKHLPSNTMVAIKRFNMDKIKHQNIHLVEREITLTRQLQHPNIISYYVAFVYQQDVYVVSPLMAFGSCRDLLNNHFNDGLPEMAIVVILRDVLDALDYIHKKAFIHRSIRAGHVLISESGRALVSGLRYACPIVSNGKFQRHIHSFPGTTQHNLNWLSPELLEQNLQGYNQLSDIYSCGMLTCELANGAEPFAGISTTLMLTEKVRGCVPQLLDCSTVDSSHEGNNGDFEISSAVLSRKFNNDLHEFTALCLQREAEGRPTAAQLLGHPLFKMLRKQVSSLPELLSPAMPLSNRVAVNSDEVVHLDVIHQLSDMQVDSFEWDF